MRRGRRKQINYITKSIEKSRSVYLSYENASTPVKQKINDAGHDKQRAILKEQTGLDVKRWQPHESVKDLAEMNIAIAKKEKSKVISNERDRGMFL